MLRLAEPLDDPVQMRNALTIRGISDLAHGRLTASIPAFERGVELLRGTGPTWLLATSLLNLGTALGHAGDDRARSILERARDMYVELGDERFAARSVMYLGYAAFVSGDVRRARDRIRDALIAFWELDDLWGVTESLEGIAATSGSADDGARAIRLAAAAEALRERVNMRPFPADHALLEGTLGRVRSMVDDPAWSRNREAGRALGLDEAVEEALRST